MGRLRDPSITRERMNNIPKKLRAQLADDPYYYVCARKGLHGHICGGRITWEHVLINAGKQLQKRAFIIPLCAKAHAVDKFQDGGDLKKDVNLWIALNRATEEEILAISKAQNYFITRAYLNKKYGTYHADEEREGIMYPWLRSPFSIV